MNQTSILYFLFVVVLTSLTVLLFYGLKPRAGYSALWLELRCFFWPKSTSKLIEPVYTKEDNLILVARLKMLAAKYVPVSNLKVKVYDPDWHILINEVRAITTDIGKVERIISYYMEQAIVGDSRMFCGSGGYFNQIGMLRGTIGEYEKEKKRHQESANFIIPWKQAPEVTVERLPYIKVAVCDYLKALAEKHVPSSNRAVKKLLDDDAWMSITSYIMNQKLIDKVESIMMQHMNRAVLIDVGRANTEDSREDKTIGHPAFYNSIGMINTCIEIWQEDCKAPAKPPEKTLAQKIKESKDLPLAALYVFVIFGYCSAMLYWLMNK